MSELINKLQEQRARVWEEAKVLADVAADEARAFAGEEQEKWDRLNGELDGLDARIEQVRTHEQRAKDAEAAMAAVRGVPAKPADKPSQADELRAFARGERGRVFEVPAERAALSTSKTGTVGTNELAGNTVPISFYGRLVEHMIEVAAILQSGATVLNTDSGEELQIPKTNDYSDASIISEGGDITESEPKFDQVSLHSYKYGHLMVVNRELIEDNGVDLQGFLARQSGRALGNGFGAHCITGDGSSKPKGVVTASTLGVTGGTGATGAFTADNLIDLYYSVIAPYRNSSACKWLMSDDAVAAVRKLKGTDGHFLWTPGLAGSPDSILGKPVLTDPNVDAPGLSKKSVLFGDFSAYYVRLVGGIRYERSEDFKFDTDQVTFRALMRADGDLIDTTGAVKHFVGGAS